MKPVRMEARTVFITSPVRRPRLSLRADDGSSSDVAAAVTVTDSRKTAVPWMGSWHMGPWDVASWKAWEILSEKSEGVRVSVRGLESVSFWVCWS